MDDLKKNDPPSDKDPLLPHPSEAADLPQSSGNLEFHCELDEFAAMVKELKASGIVQDRKQGVLGKKLKDAFTGMDILFCIKACNCQQATQYC